MAPPVSMRLTSTTSPARNPDCACGPSSSMVTVSPASAPVLTVIVAVRHLACPTCWVSQPSLTSLMVALSCVRFWASYIFLTIDDRSWPDGHSQISPATVNTPITARKPIRTFRAVQLTSTCSSSSVE